MRTRTFYDIRQAHSYLTNSIIRVAEEPVLVFSVLDTLPMEIQYCLLDHQDEVRRIRLDDEDVDMNPLPLGMAQCVRKPWSHYLYRFPVRNWKIGLTRNNCGAFNVSSKSLDMRNVSLYVPTASLISTVKGEYPCLDEAISRVTSHSSYSVPFSRDFAVTRYEGRSDLKLAYKTMEEDVGYFENGTPVLYEKYEYLKQVLEQATC